MKVTLKAPYSKTGAGRRRMSVFVDPLKSRLTTFLAEIAHERSERMREGRKRGGQTPADDQSLAAVRVSGHTLNQIMFTIVLAPFLARFRKRAPIKKSVLANQCWIDHEEFRVSERGIDL
jgi:hypothetical protein